MRTVEEVKADLELIMLNPWSSASDPTMLRLMGDAVDYLFDIRDSLRAARLRNLT